MGRHIQRLLAFATRIVRGCHTAPAGPAAVVQYGRNATGAEEPMSEELTTKVQDLIDNMINPAVAGHGGFVQLVDVKDNKVYLQMGGGCQGCGAADVTLKQGIERLIKEEIPEVEEVLDTTDHASGENPYYQPTK
jgi:Fe/S biogenesis protein NfuA